MDAARDVKQTKWHFVKTESFELWDLKWVIDYTEQILSLKSLNKETLEAVVVVFEKVLSAAQTFVEDPTSQPELGKTLKVIVYNQTGIVTNTLLNLEDLTHRYLEAMYVSWSETYRLIADISCSMVDPAWVMKIGIIILFVSAHMKYRTECYDVWRQRFETYILIAAENGFCKCEIGFEGLKTVQGVVPAERCYRANGARTTIDFAMSMIDDKITKRCT
ncbi:MAG: hypothetical protein CMP20_04490 [Rickettsiales bacterium]|nr:hypothetical protein [Rickettsiales bacterium]